MEEWINTRGGFEALWDQSGRHGGMSEETGLPIKNPCRHGENTYRTYLSYFKSWMKRLGVSKYGPSLPKLLLLRLDPGKGEENGWMSVHVKYTYYPVNISHHLKKKKQGGVALLFLTTTEKLKK